MYMSKEHFHIDSANKQFRHFSRSVTYKITAVCEKSLCARHIVRGNEWGERQDTKAGLCERVSNFKSCLLRWNSLIEESRKKGARESGNATPF